ncbi:MAG: hypothetical protein ACXQTG_04645 [Methanoculleaceae archaeon]
MIRATGLSGEDFSLFPDGMATTIAYRIREELRAAFPIPPHGEQGRIHHRPAGTTYMVQMSGDNLHTMIAASIAPV